MSKRLFLPLIIVAFISTGFIAGCGKKETPKSEAKPTTSGTTGSSGSDTSSKAAAPEAASSAASSSTAGSGDGTLAPKEGRFTVKLPAGFGEPKASTTPVPTALGTLDMTTYMAQQGEDHICMVAFADYPKEAVEKMGDDTKKVLDGAQSGAIKNMKATLLSHSDIEIDGHPARTFRFTLDANGKTGYGQFNVMLVKERMYQVCYISTEDGALDKDETKAYFTSFKPTE